ncbi:MAG: metal ABC transporter substrate-binding protein [Anaerolineales bacterium]
MTPKKLLPGLTGIILVLGSLLTACSVGPSASKNQAGQLQIVATTTFIGEVVGQIAGDAAQVTVLLEPGQNPHAYQPAPKDMVLISTADLLFSNGFGLEEFLGDLLSAADFSGLVIEVSQGIDTLKIASGGQAGGNPDPIDPHVWLDPNNLMVWTENIANTLAENDPDNAQLYHANAARYRLELEELDSWIRSQVAAIPVENRELVTDHLSFGYFADEYGFQQIGAVIPAVTTEAETSGKELAGLMDTIRKHDVKALFVSVDIDPNLAEVVAEDTGIPLVGLYFGSLTKGGPVDTYQDFMRYDVKAIAAALQ